MPHARPLLLILSAAPSTPGAPDIVVRAAAHRARGGSLHILLTEQGLAWAAEEYVFMSHHLREVVIVSAVRTPMGSFGGTLSTLPAVKLGAIAIKAAVERAGIDAEIIDECIMGCVLPAGQGQAPARQAALGANLPQKVECLTINKVCGSGLKAVMLATQAIQTGDADVVIAGGMENMSQTPYYLPDARWGMRMGPKNAVDGMVFDGLWDPYQDKHMGMFAELCADEKKYSREAQDAFAIESLKTDGGRAVLMIGTTSRSVIYAQYAFLEAVRTPMGLPIGARSHEEIAVSVVAEMIQVRRMGPPAPEAVPR